MPLPKRPATYIVLLLLVALVGIVAWIYHTVSSVDPVSVAPRSAGKDNSTSGNTSPPSSLPSLPSAGPSRPDFIIDPALQQQADALNTPDTPPQRDLEIVADFITTYSRALGSNPIGDNFDITAALTGTEGHKGRVFPPGHRTIKEGKLTDRWGTPYWFHPNSGSQMEIRSAGPDKELFTQDDIVHNQSPAGLGATPLAPLQGN